MPPPTKTAFDGSGGLTSSTSHLPTTDRNASSFSGATMAIMRSCDSLMRISSGVSDGSRNSTFSRSTRIPEPPLAASSLVAHEMPAAPRSWIASTSSPW